MAKLLQAMDVVSGETVWGQDTSWTRQNRGAKSGILATSPRQNRGAKWASNRPAFWPRLDLRR